MMQSRITENTNKQLKKWAVKFHGMKVGSNVLLYGKEKGRVVGYDFKYPYIDCYSFDKKYNSQYDPKNVKLI